MFYRPAGRPGCLLASASPTAFVMFIHSHMFPSVQSKTVSLLGKSLIHLRSVSRAVGAVVDAASRVTGGFQQQRLPHTPANIYWDQGCIFYTILLFAGPTVTFHNSIRRIFLFLFVPQFRFGRSSSVLLSLPPTNRETSTYLRADKLIPVQQQKGKKMDDGCWAMVVLGENGANDV